MDDILPQYRSPRDTPLSLGLRFFYPTLSTGITFAPALLRRVGRLCCGGISRLLRGPSLPSDGGNKSFDLLYLLCLQTLRIHHTDTEKPERSAAA